MKNIIRIWIYSLVIIGAFLLLTSNCKKDNTTPKQTEQIPKLTTDAVSNITITSAKCGGTISSDGGATITARGLCWSISANPTVSNSKTTDGNGTGSYKSDLSGLSSNTAYHARAYATNSAGTSYGNDIIIKTYTGTVNDIDGNIYYTVTIGTQTWMAENLKTTKFNDGIIIPIVTDSIAWSKLKTSGYCWYNNEERNKNEYGGLYNWYAINTKKLCPIGWHVPTDTDWNKLTTFLGEYIVAGGKLKEGGTSHWISPNTAAINSSGFTALPGGNRNYRSEFSSLGSAGYFWSSTVGNADYAYYRTLNYKSSSFSLSGNYRGGGYSVRCIKD